jgi:hypothetical protein
MSSDLHAIYDLTWAIFAVQLLGELRNWYAWLSRYPRMNPLGAADQGRKP